MTKWAVVSCLVFLFGIFLDIGMAYYSVNNNGPYWVLPLTFLVSTAILLLSVILYKVKMNTDQKE